MLLFVVGTRPPQDGIRGAGGTIYIATSLRSSAWRSSRICALAVPRPLAGKCLDQVLHLVELYTARAAPSGRLPQSNSVPSIHMRWRITAILRASAMIAFLWPLRREICAPHALSADQRSLASAALAQPHRGGFASSHRPHLEIRPLRSTSPDCCLRGVSPKCAPTVRERVKRAGTSTVARNVSATRGPTPGTVMNRRATSSWRANRTSMSSNRRNCSRKERLASSRASATVCRSVSANSSRTRGSKSRAVTLPR